MNRKLIAALCAATALSWAVGAQAQEFGNRRGPGHARAEQSDDRERGEHRRGQGQNNAQNNEQQARRGPPPNFQGGGQGQGGGGPPPNFQGNNQGGGGPPPNFQGRRHDGPPPNWARNNQGPGNGGPPPNFQGRRHDGPPPNFQGRRGPPPNWADNNGRPGDGGPPPNFQGRRHDGPPPNWARNNQGPNHEGPPPNWQGRRGHPPGAGQGGDHRFGERHRGPSHRYAQLQPRHHNFRDWRHVPRGRYFDRGYAAQIGGYYGGYYRWWGEPGWRPPHRPWRIGYALPRYVRYDPVPYALYHRLPPPPYGCRYVRHGNDILLIVLGSLLVLDAIIQLDGYDGYNDGYYDDGYYDGGYYDEGYYYR